MQCLVCSVIQFAVCSLQCATLPLVTLLPWSWFWPLTVAICACSSRSIFSSYHSQCFIKALKSFGQLNCTIPVNTTKRKVFPYNVNITSWYFEIYKFICSTFLGRARAGQVSSSHVESRFPNARVRTQTNLYMHWTRSGRRWQHSRQQHLLDNVAEWH